MMFEKKKSKLGKMEMPSKKKPEGDVDAFEMELEMEPSEEPEEGEMAEEEMGSEDLDMASPLDDVSDDELMAELRKRGLASKAMSASKKPSKDEEY